MILLVGIFGIGNVILSFYEIMKNKATKRPGNGLSRRN